MYTRLLIVVAVWHCAIVQVSSLKCYNCLNCRTVSSDDVVDCATQLTPTTTTLSATNETGRFMPNLFTVDGLPEETLNGSTDENVQFKEDSYYCYKFTTTAYQTTFIIRGCDKKVAGQTVCSAQSSSVQKCSACESDICNGSSITQLSLFVTLITMALSLATK